MAWYQIPGPDQDVAILTEVSCVRNVASFPFPARMDAGSARTLIAHVATALEPNGFTDVGLSDLPRAAAFSLAERRYVRPDLITLSRPHALFIHEPCGMTVAVGAEDHLTLTALRAGLTPTDAHSAVASVEALLDTTFELAFDERYGYLTADPALVGTGLTVTVILCLPLLEASGQIPETSWRLMLHGLLLTPITLPGTSLSGGLYRLSTGTTLGKSEEEVIGTITSAARHLIDSERKLRVTLPASEQCLLTDRLRRSQAILLAAPRLSPSEAIARLSDLRLGAAMGILTGVKVETLTVALIETMPAGLALTRGEDKRDDETLRGERIVERIRPTA